MWSGLGAAEATQVNAPSRRNPPDRPHGGASPHGGIRYRYFDYYAKR